MYALLSALRKSHSLPTISSSPSPQSLEPRQPKPTKQDHYHSIIIQLTLTVTYMIMNPIE